MTNLIKISEMFSPESRYVQLASQAILRTINFHIEEFEMVTEIDEFIL